jgi:uncharacterized protein YgiM (DUF1202 family)
MLSRLSRPTWAALAVFLAGLLIIVLALAWNASRTAAPAPAGTAAGPTAAYGSTPSPAELPTAAASATTPQVEFTATPNGPTAAPTPWARVSANAEGLRLRQAPGTAADVIRQLAAGTPLTVVGRTADNAWLQVITPQGEKGWVAAS